MAEYTGPSTDNEAVVIANMNGHVVPDRFATDDQDKFGTPHFKRIHNDLGKYDEDSPISDPCDTSQDRW